MLVLADAAHDDGVTWLGQKEIARKALISLSEVKRSIDELLSIGELEVRKAQRGRRRINVYRVSIPGLDQPNYEDMPFALNAPFTTAQDEPSPKNDDSPSSRSTTAHPADLSRARDPLGLNRNDEPSDAYASEGGQGAAVSMPGVVLIGGRNLPLDALVAACAIDGASPRMELAAIALNGQKGKDGIRDLWWVEATRYAEATDQVDRLRELTAEEVEHALAAAVTRKAAIYRQKMPGAILSPKALRDWWLDVTQTPAAAAGGMTADEIASFDEAA